jgi:hypothetical protein
MKRLIRGAARLQPESRQQSRHKAVLPVRVNGVDIDGNQFQGLAHTLDVAPGSAKLGGIRYRLNPGDSLMIQFRLQKMEFQVVWTLFLTGASEYQMGVRKIDPCGEDWGL